MIIDMDINLLLNVFGFLQGCFFGNIVGIFFYDQKIPIRKLMYNFLFVMFFGVLSTSFCEKKSFLLTVNFINLIFIFLFAFLVSIFEIE